MVDFLFHFSANVVLPFWFLMIFLPRWEYSLIIVKNPWIILPPVFCYLGLVLPYITLHDLEFFMKPTPLDMVQFLSRTWSSSAVWAYAGAFDLFVGRWIFLDSIEKKISPWWISPILFVTLFLGPLGFTLYAILSLVYFFRKKKA